MGSVPNYSIGKGLKFFLMKPNIFLTGAPSAGKTTVIKKVIDGLKCPANGFYTEEEKQDGRRVGFLMRALNGQRGYLAHQDITSDFHIRRYGISIDNIEQIAVPAITPVGDQMIILDEIGKMECFSGLFQQAAVNALNAPNRIIGTITLGGNDFIRSIKDREDVEILEVTLDNRDTLPGLILKEIDITSHTPGV